GQKEPEGWHQRYLVGGDCGYSGIIGSNFIFIRRFGGFGPCLYVPCPVFIYAWLRVLFIYYVPDHLQDFLFFPECRGTGCTLLDQYGSNCYYNPCGIHAYSTYPENSFYC